MVRFGKNKSFLNFCYEYNGSHFFRGSQVVAKIWMDESTTNENFDSNEVRHCTLIALQHASSVNFKTLNLRTSPKHEETKPTSRTSKTHWENFGEKLKKWEFWTVSLPKNVKGDPFWFFDNHSVAKYRNKWRGPFGAIQKFQKGLTMPKQI